MSARITSGHPSKMDQVIADEGLHPIVHPAVCTERYMEPFRKLANEVIKEAVADLNGIGQVAQFRSGGERQRSTRSAEFFLFDDMTMFPFWCAVSGVSSPKIMRQIIQEKINERQNEKPATKRIRCRA